MRTATFLPIIAWIASFLLFSCKTGEKRTSIEERDTLALSFNLIASFPHDQTAFTQGLVIHDGKILESTGQEGSWIAEVDMASGMQNKKITLPNQHFGEGITVLNNKIYQLTWQSHLGFIYKAGTYEKIHEFPYETEGWGLTHDGENLIMSDGTNKLYFLDTLNLKVIKTIAVRIGNEPVKNLNELEYVNGFLFANQWETTYIYKIDPKSGKVLGRLDLSSLKSEIKRINPHADVLNGIAYDPKSKAFLITGKLWPKAYLIRIL